MKKLFESIMSAIFGIVRYATVCLMIAFIAIFVVRLFDNPEKQQQNSPTICSEPQETAEPYYFDKDGIRHVLIEGTTNEYYIDDSYEEEILTPESTAFTSIGYHPFSKTLWVVFKNTGDGYHYYGVPIGVWNDFKNADSKGSFFQEEIRDQYEYDRD